MALPEPAAAVVAPASTGAATAATAPAAAAVPAPVAAPATAATATATATAPERVLAIDALRGFDMFWIAGPDLGHWLVTSVLVLLIGPLPDWLGYQLDHPKWLGFSAWDMIMPLFLFIVGAAMPFSIQRRIDAGDGRSAIYLRALRRAAILWFLGMISQGHLLDWQWSRLHFYCNTLQSIAAGYLIATVTMVELRQPRFQALTAIILLVVYWLLMALVPVPGLGSGHYDPDGNLALWIDKAVMGAHQDQTHYTWILSSLGFGATVLIGVLAGTLLRSKLTPITRLRILVLAGLACLAAGWGWSFTMPIIKHLWTSSMVLWAGGWSLLLLAAFYALIDVLGWRRWSWVFVVIGANAILAYMAQPLFDLRHLGEHLFGKLCDHLGAGREAGLAALTYVLLWLVLWGLYRARIFIRI
jgi:predicted acyltransferase